MRRVLVDQLVFFETDLPAISDGLVFVFKDLKSIGRLCDPALSWCTIYKKKKSPYYTYLFTTEADSLQSQPVLVKLNTSGQYTEPITARNAGTSIISRRKFRHMHVTFRTNLYQINTEGQGGERKGGGGEEGMVIRMRLRRSIMMIIVMIMSFIIMMMMMMMTKV